MKPAICFLCGKSAMGKNSPDKGAWLKFAEYQRVNATSLSHPDGLEYVCGEHLAAAQALTFKSSKDALADLKNKFEDWDCPSRNSQVATLDKSWWQRLINRIKQ